MLRQLRRRVFEGWAHRRSRRQAVPAKAELPRGVEQAQVDELLKLARQSFVELQTAWDRADLCTLRQLTTEPLLDDLRHQLAQRGPGPNYTEVVRLDARLLRLEELHEAFVASVEFTGLIRERLDAGACPFRELWLLANIKTAGRGWQLARVQSLS